MCGIVFVSREDKKSAAKMTLKRFRHQRTRGTQGFGYISVDANGTFHEWGRSKDEKGIEELMDKDNSPTFLFHHRMPTSTPNFIEATHPIKVSKESLDHDYYVVHNGIINNDRELKAEHELEGFEYTTAIVEKFETKQNTYSREMFNDSEALAIEVAKVLDGDQKEIKAKGSIAFIAFQVNKHTQKIIALYFGRNFSNPLRLYEGQDFFSLSSEGAGNLIEPDHLYRYDWKEKTFRNKELNIGESTSTYDKGKYPTYTHKKEEPTTRRMGFRTAEEDSESYSMFPPEFDTGSHYGKPPTPRVIELPAAMGDLQDEEEEFVVEDMDAVVAEYYDEAAVLESQIEYFTESGLTYQKNEAEKRLREVNKVIFEFEESEREYMAANRT